MLIVHAYIEVAELERGINFYCEGLGLSLKRRLGPSWVELDRANLPIFLLCDRPAMADLGGKRVRRSFAAPPSTARSNIANTGAWQTWPIRSATVSI